MIVPGNKAKQSAASFPLPDVMTLAQMENEVVALLNHQEKMLKQGDCTRKTCDGSPHVGFPYPHKPVARVKPDSPLAQAQELDSGYRERPHLKYLSDRLVQAVKDLEGGEDRFLIVSMPPRMGKSQLTSVYLPLWLLNLHPDWKMGLISHDPTLAVGWGRQIRRIVEDEDSPLDICIAPDAGAVANWETTAKGSVSSRSVGQSVTGRGFKVLLVDDPVKDYAAAHSAVDREALWNWWIANAFTRREKPSLTIIIGTRWHEDDMIGRLLSPEYNPDLDKWEVISFPAIAEDDDVLGRSLGEPLMSPLVEDESVEESLADWNSIRRMIGLYMWNALYQQRPSPAKGSIFNRDWWRYWTLDPGKVSTDTDGKPDPRGQIVYFDPSKAANGKWLDSWDLTFGGSSEAGDFVVGQRWVGFRANKYLVSQKRGRWQFPDILRQFVGWAKNGEPSVESTSPWGAFVRRRVVEKAAAADPLITSLQDEVSGIVAKSPVGSKVDRARAVSADVESGNVFLPLPSDPGNEWVLEFLDEVTGFDKMPHDDQVDSFTQALIDLKVSDGQVSVSTLSGAGRASRVRSKLSGRSIR